MKYILSFILLTLNFSAQSATWKKIYKSTFITVTPEVLSCPEGYIGVPALIPYTLRYFCVMKYEAKNDTYDTPVSTAANVPWPALSRDNARSKCQSLGGGYDLISNEQWQSIARNIAGVSSNWDNGIIGNVQLNRGHSDNSPGNTLAADIDDNNACFGKLSICNASTWHAQRRTHTLTNGNKIWDFSGNASEWVINDAYVTYGLTDYISKISDESMRQITFGALGSTLCSSPESSPYCGMGHGNFTSHAGGILRGGHYNETSSDKAGVFTTNMASAPGATNAKQGFRCVFVP